MSQDKPVAAHEPVFFVSPGQLPSIKDSGYWPYRKQMEGLFTLPLYAHAAPCARCAELEDAAPLVRDLMVRVVEKEAKITEQAERIKALEELFRIEHCKYANIKFELAKADAVILQAKDALRSMNQISWYYKSRSALASIEQYQKGE